MSEPRYYRKYNHLFPVDKPDDRVEFIAYLEGLSYEDMRSLLQDLLYDHPYPQFIQKVRKEYSTRAYYAIFFSKLSQPAKNKIIVLLDEEADKHLSLENKGATEFFNNAIELSRQLEWGLSGDFLIKNIIINKSFDNKLKYDAALALSLYKDKDVKHFWKETAAEAIRIYSFLSFPRFLALVHSDATGAFLSLEFFEKAEYIEEIDLNYHLENFLLNLKDDKKRIRIVSKYYHKLNVWLKGLIEKLIDNNQLHWLKGELNRKPTEIGFPAESHIMPVADLIRLENIKDFVNDRMQINLLLPLLDNISHISKFKLIYEKLNPYKPFDDTIFSKKLVPAFHLINTGNSYFKKSRFEDAITCYTTVLDSYYKKPSYEHFQMYLYSWALHEIANVFFVTGDIKRATNTFTESFSIKRSLNDLPKSLLFATQLKMVGMCSYDPEIYPGWEDNIHMFLDGVTTHYKSQKDKNEIFELNLLGDAAYYLCNGYARKGDWAAFQKHFRLCFDFTSRSNDKIGLIRLLVLACMVKGDLDISAVRAALLALSEEEKKDPYMTTILWDFWNKTANQSLNSLTQVFLECKIPNIASWK